MMRKQAKRLMSHFSQRERACGIGMDSGVVRGDSDSVRRPFRSGLWRRLCWWFVVLPLIAFAQESADLPDARTFGTSNSDMLAAIARARSTLDQFLDLAGNPAPGMSGFKMKVIVRDGKNLENFWITPFRVVGEDFEGVVANRPEIIGNVRLGETIRFPRADVSDWGYVRDGRQVGSFTVCVLFRYMPPHAADYFRRTNGFDC